MLPLSYCISRTILVERASRADSPIVLAQVPDSTAMALGAPNISDILMQPMEFFPISSCNSWALPGLSTLPSLQKMSIQGPGALPPADDCFAEHDRLYSGKPLSTHLRRCSTSSPTILPTFDLHPRNPCHFKMDLHFPAFQDHHPAP